MSSEPSLNETSISTNIVVTDNCVVSADSIDENQMTSGNLIVEKSGNTYTINIHFFKRMILELLVDSILENLN